MSTHENTVRRRAPRGSITLTKAILDNPLWLAEPFSRAQAMVDLFLLANDAPRDLFLRGRPVRVLRGQIARAVEKLAERWMWGDEKAAGFLRLLEKAGTIKVQKSHVVSIITVVNYDTYNDPSDWLADEVEAVTGAVPASVTGSVLDQSPDAGTEPGTGAGQKEEGGIGREEPLRARDSISGVPDDEDVGAFGRGFAGELGAGTPGPIPAEYVACVLREWHGRREFPIRWERALVASWRADCRAWTAGTHRWQFALNGPQKKNGAEKSRAFEGREAAAVPLVEKFADI
jgi:hypothetical protein